MYLIMLGAQGTGKGTVAGLLSKSTGWPQISTGDIFRANISEKTELGNKANEYISKGQLKLMKSLTYHHMKEKSKGGPTTVENGAILSVENHEWFNKQSPEVQAELNKRFKEYKECKVVYSDDVQVDFEIHATTFEIDEKAHIESKYNRAKEKEKLRRRIEEEYDRDDH